MIETDHSESAAASASVPAEPPAVLVVHGSSRGWMAATLPPALILVSALVITSHQLRPPPPIYAPSSPEKSRVPRISLTPSSSVDPGVVAVRVVGEEAKPEPRPAVATVESDGDSETLPVLEGAEGSVDDPQPAGAVVRVDVEGAGLESERAEVGKSMSEEGRPAQVVWEDIEAEAREARQKKQEDQALRGEVFARKEAAARDRLMRARLTAATDRGQFLSDLRTLVRRHGRKAGPYISELVVLYGRSMPPELQEAADRVRSRMNGSGASAEVRIRAYRELGLPETCILDELSQQLLRSIGTRKGPRNRDEVLYFASRLLMNVPLERPGAANSSR